VQAPYELFKEEAGIFGSLEKNEPSPTLVTNLVRLSKGEMIGVKFNKDKDWDSKTIELFEK
jgi:hypothetical protein